MGDCFEPKLIAKLRELVAGDDRIILRVEPLSDQMFSDCFSACDLVLLCQSKMLNSGTVMAALSLGAPVAAMAVGSLLELQGIVGREWLNLFQHITGPDVQALLQMPRPANLPDLSSFDLSRIGELHLDAYGLSSK